MENKQEVVVPEGTPLEIFKLAATGNIDLAKAEKFLELQERWEAKEAKKAYHAATAEFKKNPPQIYKDKKNKQFNSWYTSIDSLVNTAIPELSKFGLSHSWNYGTAANGNPSVTCILTHKLGYSVSVTQDAPLTQSKNSAGQIVTNPIQQMKSTQTYLKITTFEAVTGLVSKEANLDDDGNASGTIELIDENKLKIIKGLLEEVKANETDFLKYMGIEKLEDMPKALFAKAKISLETRKKQL